MLQIHLTNLNLLGNLRLGDLSPLCEITDCLDSHCNYCILHSKIALTMVNVTSAKQMAFVQWVIESFTTECFSETLLAEQLVIKD